MKTLLPILLFTFLVTGYQAKSTPVAGADLYYEYIGNSTGISHHYRINLVLYRDTQGAGLGSFMGVDISSPCGFNKTVNLTKYIPAGADTVGNGGAQIPYYSECLDTAPSSSTGMKAHYYRGDVVLPGKCVYRFSWNLCCRNGNITNLLQASSSNLYIQSHLDNTLGPNSGVHFFISPGVKVFCVGAKSVNWLHAGSESDGDSVRFVLAQPWHDANIPVPWATGFSTNQPITTAGGVSFNEKNGLIEFQPTAQENDVFKIIAEEYRFDTVTMNWRLIGTSEREAQALITTTCNQGTTFENIGTDSISPGGLPEVSCGSKRIHVKTSVRLKCGSIDSTNFLLFGQDTSQTIAAVGTDSCPNGLTSSFWIELQDSLYYNDTLMMELRASTYDSSNIVTACGFELDPGTALEFIVDCGTDLAVAEELPRGFELFPNPATDKLTIEFSQTSSDRRLQILNLQGRIIKEFEACPSHNVLDIADLPKGIYLIRSSEYGNFSTMRFRKA